MHALLIVNPRASSTTQVRRDVIARALASELDLEVVQTRYRGHACHVAAAAAKEGYDVVLTLGGDGTVHEAVNGLLSAPQTQEGPLLAALPGGNANVFTRALGLPPDLVDATGEILAALTRGSSRSIGVGLADGQYFCINAGLGLDAEAVRVVEGRRARRHSATPGLYVWAAARQFFLVTDRHEPALTLEIPGKPPREGVFCAIVSNTSPWTYLGHRPINPNPRASFSTGLDLFALGSLGTLETLNALRQMFTPAAAPLRGKHMTSLHNASVFTLRASRPVAFQLDGEYVGERECVTFHAIPSALRVIV